MRGDARRQRDARQPRRLRLLGAVEGAARRDARPRRRRAGARAAPTAARRERRPATAARRGGHVERRRGIAADQRFERAQRLLVAPASRLRAVSRSVAHVGARRCATSYSSPRRRAGGRCARPTSCSDDCAHRVRPAPLQRASIARNQPLATSAAIDCRAYSASSCVARRTAARATPGPRARGPTGRAPRSRRTPTPDRPLLSPHILPPPRAEQVDLRIEHGARQP